MSPEQFLFTILEVEAVEICICIPVWTRRFNGGTRLTAGQIQQRAVGGDQQALVVSLCHGDGNKTLRQAGNVDASGLGSLISLLVLVSVLIFAVPISAVFILGALVLFLAVLVFGVLVFAALGVFVAALGRQR